MKTTKKDDIPDDPEREGKKSQEQHSSYGL